MFNFGVMTSVEEVPEEFRGVYVPGEGENKGKFVVGAPFTGFVASYTGTIKSLDEARKNNGTYTAEAAEKRVALKSVKEALAKHGVTIADDDKRPLNEIVDGVLSDLTGKVKGGEELKVNLEKIKGEYDRRLAESLGAKDKELNAMGGSLRKHMISTAALTALGAEKGNSTLLMPHIEKYTKVVKDGDEYVVRVVDDKGDVRSDGAGGWLTVGSFVKSLRGEKDYSAAFASENKGGGGSNQNQSKTGPSAGGGSAKSSIDKIAGGIASR